MTKLERLRGIGPQTAEYLRNAGYETAEDVLDAERSALLEVKGVGYAIVENLEIQEEREFKGIRMPREWRATLKESVEDTSFTLSDALRAVLPDNPEEHIMCIPEDEYVYAYVESDVHSTVQQLAGENVTSLDVLEKYLGNLGPEDLRRRLDNKQSDLYRYEENQ